MARIDDILEGQIQEKEMTWDELKALVNEAGGFLSLPAVMALMDQINKDQGSPKGMAPLAKAYVTRLGDDAIRITITNRGRPVAKVEMSLPGMVSLLSQYKR